MVDIELAQLPQSFVVFLARHATPNLNRKDIPYHLVPGPELTELGLQQAGELGAFLASQKVKHFLASPLERTWRTATIASQACQASLEMNPDLAEHRLDETVENVKGRSMRAFQAAAKLSAQDGPVAIVTHGSPVLALLTMLGLSQDAIKRFKAYDSGNIIPMAGAWRVERSEGGLIHLELVFAPSGIKIIPMIA